MSSESPSSFESLFPLRRGRYWPASTPSIFVDATTSFCPFSHSTPQIARFLPSAAAARRLELLLVSSGAWLRADRGPGCSASRKEKN